MLYPIQGYFILTALPYHLLLPEYKDILLFTWKAKLSNFTKPNQ